MEKYSLLLYNLFLSLKPRALYNPARVKNFKDLAFMGFYEVLISPTVSQ